MAKQKLSRLGKTPDKPEDVFADLRQNAQDRIKNQLFTDAQKEGGTNDLLMAFAEEIANECGSELAKGPIKTLKSAERKLKDDYTSKLLPEGDWYEMKDLCRCTIIAPNPVRLKKVGQMIRKRCMASNRMGIIKDAEAIAHIDPCGYSGLNFVVRLTNGRPGEIQANIPEVMYGKMTTLRFLNVLGVKRYYELRGRFRIDGGMGHGLYEIWRKKQAGLNGRRAALISKLYYNYLRGFPHEKVRQELKRELNSIVKANRDFFNPFKLD
jgi:hypothetical protein